MDNSIMLSCGINTLFINSNKSAIVFVLFIFYAALSFAPLFTELTLKYDASTADDPSSTSTTPNMVYPDFMLELNGNQVMISLGFSIGAASPVLVDYIFDSFCFLYFKPSQSHLTSIVISFRRIVVFITAIDLITMVYLIPYEHFEVLYILIQFRDIVFTISFLLQMHTLFPTIWRLWAVIIFGLILSLVEFFVEAIMFYPEFYDTVANCIVPLQAIAFAILFVQYFIWFRYVASVTNETIKKKASLCNYYAVAFLIFICGNWAVFFNPNGVDPSWYSVLGKNFLTLYTYVITCTTITVTIITTRLAKTETMEAERLLSTEQMFMRYISHEIRTPMNTVFVGLKLLENELSGESINFSESLVIVRDVKKAAEVALEVLNDMLLFDKLKGGLWHPEIQEVSPWTFITTTISPFLIQAQESEVSLSIGPDASRDVLSAYSILIDVSKFAQVIRNLISNALKFTSKGGTVRVLIEPIGDGHGLGSIGNNNSIDVTDDHSYQSQANAGGVIPVELSRITPVVIMRDNMTTGGEREVVMFNKLRISVEDSGPGISEDNQKKLFSQIIQFHPGKLQNGGGTGLGLFISKGIVDSHHGTIRVMSEGEGYGCTFTVDIPLYPASTTSSITMNYINNNENNCNNNNSNGNNDIAINTTSDEHLFEIRRDNNNDNNDNDIIVGLESMKSRVPYRHGSQSSNYIVATDSNNLHRDDYDYGRPVHHPVHHPLVSLRVLVVDDSAMNRKMVCRLLTQQKYVCLEAVDGLDAVEKVRSTRTMTTGDGCYDVILMDYQMPNMDGPSAIRVLREEGYVGPIFGLTGNVLAADMEVMIAAGANKVLEKPFDFEKFVLYVTKYHNVLN